MGGPLTGARKPSKRLKAGPSWPQAGLVEVEVSRSGRGSLERITNTLETIVRVQAMMAEDLRCLANASASGSSVESVRSAPEVIVIEDDGDKEKEDEEKDEKEKKDEEKEVVDETMKESEEQ